MIKHLPKFLTKLAMVIFPGMAFAQTLTFTIISSNSSFTLTCANPTLSLIASTSFTGTANFFWDNGTFTSSGATVQVNSPGIYTVTMNTPGSAVSQTLQVFSNSVAPSSTVTPLSLNISCNSAESFFINMYGTPGANVTHSVMSPYGGTVTATTNTLSYYVGNAGTYTHVLTDNATGCFSVTLFTVTASPGIPGFSLTSSQNYSLGCNSGSVVSVNMINGSTTPIPGGAVSYTILSPGSNSNVPGGTLSPISSFTVNSPGIYTVVIKDNASGCIMKLPFSVAPTPTEYFPPLSLSSGPDTLTCLNPTVQLIAGSSQTNAVISWASSSGTSAGGMLIVAANSAVPGSTVAGIYTVSATHPIQGCKTSSVVSVLQNIAPPNASATTGSQSSLTCLSPSVVLTNISTSNVLPPFTATAPVSVFLWSGPGVGPPAPAASTYTAYVNGVYTLEVIDQNNGCRATTTISVGDSRIYPDVGSPLSDFNLCGNATVQIYPAFGPGSGNLTYTWTSPPAANVAGASSATLTTNTPGTYTLTSQNSAGCAVNTTVQVSYCVGLAEQNGEDFVVYPVPAKDHLTIRIGTDNRLQAILYNVIGQKVRTYNLTGTNSCYVGDLPPGMYTLAVFSERRQTRIQRIVLEK